MTDLSQQLLRWYEKNGRSLPWRVKGGPHPDPYVILVSEFMLQQTTVKAVIPYFYRFMQRFPTLQSLAEAAEQDVYQMWQGLGYYTRARSLHTAARQIMQDHNGRFPQTRDTVLKLKGIGEYTASSFLALAFNLPETVIDGNVIRIICRMYRLTSPAADIMPLIREKAAALTNRNNAADYASAIMDLGATVCTPKKPQCLLCPWRQACLSASAPDVENIPLRLKNTKPEKHGCVYLIRNRHGQIFIRKRTEKGLLSGLFEFPWSAEEALFPTASPQDSGQQVSHVFTHFKLTLRIFTFTAETEPLTGGLFVSPQELPNFPISTLMKKVAQSGIK